MWAALWGMWLLLPGSRNKCVTTGCSLELGGRKAGCGAVPASLPVASILHAAAPARAARVAPCVADGALLIPRALQGQALDLQGLRRGGVVHLAAGGRHPHLPGGCGRLLGARVCCSDWCGVLHLAACEERHPHLPGGGARAGKPNLLVAEVVMPCISPVLNGILIFQVR